MLNLQVRLVEDNGTVHSARSRVLNTASIEYTTAINSAPMLTFKASRDEFTPTAYPFVVRVERAVNGGDFSPTPQHSLFIIEKDSDDSKDPGGIATYTGVGYVSWLISGALVSWSSTAKDGKRTWYEPNKKAASAGWMLHGMLTESKNAGWFPALTWNFNGTKDSGGNAWVAGDKTITEWELTKNLGEVLTAMTDDGLCEWTTVGNGLRMYRMGKMGVDKPDIVLGGRGYSSVPVTTDATGLYSHIRAIPDKLPWQNYTSDTTLRARFGHRSIVLTQSGIKDVASSKKNAAPYIEAGKEAVREESYVWTPTSATAHPLSDFNLGDQVTAESRGGRKLRRVVAIAIKQEGKDPAEADVRVGKFIKSRAAKLKNKLESIAVGGISGGSGSGFPASPGPTKNKPAAPVGVIVTSNTAEWLEGGAAQASVSLEWEAVTMAEDGSEIDVVEYEVWSRSPAAVRTRDLATMTTEATVTSWPVGQDRLISVRAKSELGEWSEFSTEFLIRTVIPDSIVPKAPQNLRIVSNVGIWSPAGPRSLVTITWDRVTESTDNLPIEVSTYEVFNTSEFFSTADRTYVYNTAPDVQTQLQVRAGTSLGIFGDPSTPLNITGAYPPQLNYKPSTPTLTSNLGNVYVSWDGLYDIPSPVDASHVSVEAKIGAGQWVQRDTLASSGQTSIRLGNLGDTVYVRLRAYDRLGRLTGTSATATITVTGVDITDLDQAVTDMLSEIDELAGNAWDAASAAVKNSVTEYAVGSSETAAPSTGWSTATPVRTPGSFVWMRTVITYGNDTTSTTSPVLVSGTPGAPGVPGAPGTPGAPGADGVGVSSVTQFYYVTSATAAAPAAPTMMTPPPPWTATEPAYSPGTALWAVTRVVYTNDTFAYSLVSKVSAYQAAVLADGKLTLATVAPTTAQGTGKPAGALWMVKTGGKFTKMWEWNGTAWVDTPLDETIIPKVAIGAGTYGELDGVRMKARSVTAEKVLIVPGQNEIWDGNYTAWDSSAWASSPSGGPGSGWSTEVVRPGMLVSQKLTEKTAPASTASLYSAMRAGVSSVSGSNLDRVMFVENRIGEKLVAYAHFYVDKLPPGGMISLSTQVYFYNSANSNFSNQNGGRVNRADVKVGEWMRVGGTQLTVPEGAVYAVVRPTIYYTNNTTDVNGTNYYLGGEEMYWANAAELLVDGAVKARHVEMETGFFDKLFGNEAMIGRVVTNHLASDVGTNLDISSNGTVTIIGERQDEVSTLLDTVQQDLTTTNDLAGQAVSDAADAAAAAGIADSKALVAETRATTAQAAVNTLKSRFEVLGKGAQVISEDRNNAVVISPTQISIVQGGVESSYWSGTQLVSQQIVTKLINYDNKYITEITSGQLVDRPR